MSHNDLEKLIVSRKHEIIERWGQGYFLSQTVSAFKLAKSVMHEIQGQMGPSSAFCY